MPRWVRKVNRIVPRRVEPPAGIGKNTPFKLFSIILDPALNSKVHLIHLFKQFSCDKCVCIKPTFYINNETWMTTSMTLAKLFEIIIRKIY